MGRWLFLSPSRFLAGKFREMGFKHPIEVLPNPTAAQMSGGGSTTPRQPHVLFVGRVVPEKGVRTLCSAAVTSGVHIKIAGDGSQLSELKAQFDAQANIDFLGRLEPARAQQLMREATAVAVPSEWYENQSMVILEAFANGTPVIASSIGGNTKLVADGDTGLLHPPGVVDALAAKLRWAVEHGARWRAWASTPAPSPWRSAPTSTTNAWSRFTTVCSAPRRRPPRRRARKA